MTYYTHAGLFHADEVFGYAICKLAEVSNSFERLTDITNIPDGGIVADIGREYDPAKNKFDHHQGFLTRDNGYPYASCGLLWEEYGEQVCKKLGIDTYYVKAVSEKVAASLVTPIDAHDSDPKYKVTGECSAGEVNIITLPNVISVMNAEDVNDQEEQHFRFSIAVDIAVEMIRYYVKKSYKQLKAEDDFDKLATIINGYIIQLEEVLPWKEIVHEKYPKALYVISPSNHPGNKWAMIAVTVEPTSRECKLPIQRPDWFKGFIHEGKWIAGANHPEELVRLAEYNINIPNREVSE